MEPIFQSYVKEYTSEATLTLVDIMRNSKSEHARISAAVHLMERGHGKVPQGSWARPEERTKFIYESMEELRQDLLRRGLPMRRRLMPFILDILRENDAAEREKGQNSQSAQPAPGSEEQWGSDEEDT